MFSRRLHSRKEKFLTRKVWGLCTPWYSILRPTEYWFVLFLSILSPTEIISPIRDENKTLEIRRFGGRVEKSLIGWKIRWACSSAFRWQFAGAHHHEKCLNILHTGASNSEDYCELFFPSWNFCRRENSDEAKVSMFQMLGWFCRFLRVLFFVWWFLLSVGVVFIQCQEEVRALFIYNTLLLQILVYRWLKHKQHSRIDKVSQVFLPFVP